MGKIKNLTHQIFGHLQAIQPTNQRRNSCVVWRCKCLYCGNDQVFRESRILQKKGDHNCGCHKTSIQLNNLKKASTIIDLTNQEFGDFKVLFMAPHEKYQPIKWHCKCKLCGQEKDINSQSLRLGKSKYCKCHRASRGEDAIKELLIKNNISFIQEKSFQSCKKSNAPMPFDFYVNGTYLIEYDGQQHFKSIEVFGGQTRFKATQETDKFKNNWALVNNIPLIRIPYTALQTLTLQDVCIETSKYLIKKQEF